MVSRRHPALGRYCSSLCPGREELSRRIYSAGLDRRLSVNGPISSRRRFCSKNMDSQTAAGQPGLGRGHETLPQRCGRPAAAQPALLADMARNPSVHDLIRQGTTLREKCGLRRSGPTIPTAELSVGVGISAPKTLSGRREGRHRCKKVRGCSRGSDLTETIRFRIP